MRDDFHGFLEAGLSKQDSRLRGVDVGSIEITVGRDKPRVFKGGFTIFVCKKVINLLMFLVFFALLVLTVMLAQL